MSNQNAGHLALCKNVGQWVFLTKEESVFPDVGMLNKHIRMRLY